MGATLTYRSRTLDEALTDIDAGTVLNVARIVVNRRWWEALSDVQQDRYHTRCLERGIDVSADDRISRHYVELVSREDPPLSSERHT